MVKTFMYPKPEWRPYLLFLGVGLKMDSPTRAAWTDHDWASSQV